MAKIENAEFCARRTLELRHDDRKRARYMCECVMCQNYARPWRDNRYKYICSTVSLLLLSNVMSKEINHFN